LDSSLITVLANGVTPGVVIILIILGYLVPKPAYTRVAKESARKDKVIEKLQEALTLERQRSNDATQAGAVTNQLIGALTTLATEHRAAEKQEHSEAADLAADVRLLPAAALDLTGKDIGL
jgi:hypothetical protein